MAAMKNTYGVRAQKGAPISSNASSMASKQESPKVCTLEKKKARSSDCARIQGSTTGKVQ